MHPAESWLPHDPQDAVVAAVGDVERAVVADEHAVRLVQFHLERRAADASPAPLPAAGETDDLVLARQILSDDVVLVSAMTTLPSRSKHRCFGPLSVA